jgi:hypothetical protein
MELPAAEPFLDSDKCSAEGEEAFGETDIQLIINGFDRMKQRGILSKQVISMINF